MAAAVLIGFCTVIVLVVVFSVLSDYSREKEREARQEYLRRQAKEKSGENRVSCCGRCYPYGNYQRPETVEAVETVEPLSVDIAQIVNNYETPSYEHLTVDVPAISYNETVETPSVDYTPAYEASSQPSSYDSSSESSYSSSSSSYDSSPSYGDSNAGCDNSSSYDSFSGDA